MTTPPGFVPQASLQTDPRSKEAPQISPTRPSTLCKIQQGVHVRAAESPPNHPVTTWTQGSEAPQQVSKATVCVSTAQESSTNTHCKTRPPSAPSSSWAHIVPQSHTTHCEVRPPSPKPSPHRPPAQPPTHTEGGRQTAAARVGLSQAWRHAGTALTHQPPAASASLTCSSHQATSTQVSVSSPL